MKPRRVRTHALLALLVLFGCDRSAPPTSGPVPDVAPTREGRVGVSPANLDAGLRDWVLNPIVSESERDATCPRLLSAAPNVTEICCALGLTEHLIGRTRYCTYPPHVRDVQSIGDLYNLNVEVLLGLRPELILVSGKSRAITDRLAALNLRFESLPDTTLDDLFDAIERVGVLTNRRETARCLVAGVRADFESVAARFADAPRARVLLLTGPLPDPPMQADAAGPGSFYDHLLRRAGHANVAKPSGRPFCRLSLEFILQADPDVIVELAPDQKSRPAGDADARHVWAKIGPLKAVAQRRVHVLVGEQHFILGPRFAQTFEALCRIISDQHDG